jgi:hypothetical protein
LAEKNTVMFFGLWSKARAKAALERKTMREIIFESLNLREASNHSSRNRRREK